MTDPMAFYQWEFLRRNPGYQKDYKQLQEKLGTDPLTFDQQNHRAWLALYVSTASEVAQKFPQTDLAAVRAGFHELGRFQEKWRVMPIRAPHEFFHLLSEYLPRTRDADARPEALEILPPAADAPTPQRYLTVRLDLSAAAPDILRRVEDAIHIYQNLTSSQTFAEVKDPRWARLDQCLRVYDEVVVGGKNLEEGARVIFSEFSQSTRVEQEKMLEQIKILVAEAQAHVENGI